MVEFCEKLDVIEVKISRLPACFERSAREVTKWIVFASNMHWDQWRGFVVTEPEGQCTCKLLSNLGGATVHLCSPGHTAGIVSPQSCVSIPHVRDYLFKEQVGK